MFNNEGNKIHDHFVQNIFYYEKYRAKTFQMYFNSLSRIRILLTIIHRPQFIASPRFYKNGMRRIKYGYCKANFK